jgi:hypothetical protein
MKGGLVKSTHDGHRGAARPRFSPASLAALLPVALLVAACGSDIGDGCSDNIDCATDGTRICDRSQIGGYCTVFGCDANSCPDGSVCAEFFTAAFLDTPCDPATEDAVDPAVDATDDCTTQEVCLSSGFCARPSLGQRFCVKRCGGDGDCRGGYECRSTGTFGAQVVLDPQRPTVEPARFCTQEINP